MLKLLINHFVVNSLYSQKHNNIALPNSLHFTSDCNQIYVTRYLI